jgi:anthranilate phosphoribosyltransferase
MLFSFARDPAVFLAVPFLVAAIAHKLDEEVIIGLYEGLKAIGFYKEEGLTADIPNAVFAVGTGGKEISTINVSTASAFVAASCGGRVVRSGTRRFFGLSGASDFLAAHQITPINELDLIKPMIERVGLALVDGDAFSPMMGKSLLPIVRTSSSLKNLVAAISHPIRHAVTLLQPDGIGCAFRGISLPITRHVAEALMSYRRIVRGLVVFSEDNQGRVFDELSNFGPTQISEVSANGISTYTLWPQDVGLSLAKVSDIEVSDPRCGHQLVLDILKGKRPETDPVVQLLALNSGALLYSGNSAQTIQEGVQRSLTAIGAGAPGLLMDSYRKYYADVLQRTR